MTKKDPHVALLQAEIRRLENEAPVGLSRIYASFPQLRDLISTLAWYVIAADPTASKVIDPDMPFISKDRTHDGIVPFGKRATFASALSTTDARDAIPHVNRQLKYLIRKLSLRLEGRDRHGDYRAEKPRCGKRSCPEPWKRQDYGTKMCTFCGQPMTAGSTEKAQVRA